LKKVGGEHRLAFMDQDVMCPLPLALLDITTVNSADQEHPTIDATSTDASAGAASIDAGASGATAFGVTASAQISSLLAKNKR